MQAIQDRQPALFNSGKYYNDALGRRTQRSDYYNDRINNPSTTANTFGYNTFSEVTNMLAIAEDNTQNKYAYDYDPIGNRIETTTNSVTMEYLSNGLNQYTNISNSQLSTLNSFDDDGNMLTNATHAFTWDAENRLLTASNLTTAVVCNFIYDHQSRRISKTVLISSLITQHSSFTYDGWNLISEVIDDQTVVSTNVYVWGLDLSGTLQGAGGVGGLLSQTVIMPTSKISYFPLADANGNAVTFVDEAGNVQAHYVYDAFGGTVSSDGDKDDDFRFRFSSKYLDDETGLYYYGYRYFSPALGRWVSRDPLGDVFGLRPEILIEGPSLFVFVHNNIYQWIDYLGLTGIRIVDNYPGFPNAANCLGGAMTERNNEFRSPLSSDAEEDDGVSFAEALGTEGWSCFAVTSVDNCKCECEQRQMLITAYKNTDARNANKSPWFSPDFYYGNNQRTDIHAISTPYGGCQYEQIPGTFYNIPGSKGAQFDSNIDWSLFPEGSVMLCCCKDRYSED